MAARYLVGIDLGTTNTALAFVDLERKRPTGRPDLQTFPVAQRVANGDLGERPLLPSFLYLPGPDLPPGAVALPWDASPPDVVGEFARQHGSRVPGRLVSSAKSWLCHPGVDRTAALLPWGAPPDVPRRSPLEASARYLKHLVDTWNNAPGRDPADRLEDQPVVLTVPASFDDVARNLTVEAAKQAGLKHVSLLEEPQAAFYCWLALHSGEETNRLKPGMTCLVVDVGGGTSDFSLIKAVEEKGELAFVREAVGDHLLLGGDNMDLALARAVEPRLAKGGRLDAAQFGQLVQACRQAKETLLAPDPPAEVPITVMGRGRAVVGGTLTTHLTGAELRQVLFDGFFPHCPADAEPQRPARAGLHEMGLPYVHDPAVTRHLAAFVRRQGGSPPDAILFNGGVFQPQALRDRVVEVMAEWYGTPGQPYRPVVLDNPSLDLAVAWGAAFSGWLRHTGGRRIGGGIARSYYLAVADGEPAASEGVPSSTLTVLCVAPKHLEEGHEIALPKPVLELALGQPVRFPLYTSTVRGQDQAGDVLAVDPERLLHLPALQTLLRGGKRTTGARTVPVTLATRSTEIGTLEVYCVATDNTNRWRLEFNVREIVQGPPPKAEAAETGPDRTVTEVFPEDQVQEAGRLIRGCYTAPEPSPDPRDLTKALESSLGSPRDDWPTGLCRRVWDFLLGVTDQRRRSPQHLSRWYNLVGFCLRPGFGDPLDRYRVEMLWKIVSAPQRTTDPLGARPAVADGGADFWIMWRRASGGLNGALQQSLFDRVRPLLLPSKGKGGAVKPGSNELAEIWRAVASLERLDVRVKAQLGDVLVKQLRRSPTPTYGFWSLTRVGARVLLYGPLNAVVHPEVVQGWIEALLPFQPGNDNERLGWAFCLAQLARRSGQRALDVDEGHRQSVLAVLREQAVPAGWVRMVEEVVEMEGEERSRLFGDALPMGLRLAAGE
jgi:molecular chaperone DnaK (HSP70)